MSSSRAKGLIYLLLYINCIPLGSKPWPFEYLVNKLDLGETTNSRNLLRIKYSSENDQFYY